MRSRFSFGFTLPQALQVRQLGNHMGARITRVCRHWPLASSSRAGTQYPRHLARILDFPGSAHPRQERGGARLSQHGVTAPGDDAGYVDLEGNHQVGDQDSFPPKRVTGLVSPSLYGMARAGPSRSIGPLPGGNKFFKVITGFKILAPCIAKRHPNPLPVEFRGTGVADVQCHAAREPRWRHDDSGVKPEVLVNQPPLHTHPALGRRLDWDDPGVRGPVICRTGVPCRSLQGTVCRSRSGIPGRFGYWGTMPEPGWPWGEAASSCSTAS